MFGSGLATLSSDSGSGGRIGAGSSRENMYEDLSPVDISHFRNIMVCIVCIGSFFSLLFHVGVKEPPIPAGQRQYDQTNSSVSETTPLNTSRTRRQMMRKRDWFRMPQFYLVGLLYMCSRLYINISMVYLSLYLQETLDLPKASIAVIPLISYLSGFSSSFGMKALNARFGRTAAYLIGVVV
ncbi:unnamed protein product, partial [Cyprideis torosa]